MNDTLAAVAFAAGLVVLAVNLLVRNKPTKLTGRDAYEMLLQRHKAAEVRFTLTVDHKTGRQTLTATDVLRRDKTIATWHTSRLGYSLSETTAWPPALYVGGYMLTPRDWDELVALAAWQVSSPLPEKR